MVINNGCFISYPHTDQTVDRGYLKEFTRQLAKALANSLSISISPNLLVYLDENRLRPGHNYDDALSQAIC